jgi:hypothetical protein
MSRIRIIFISVAILRLRIEGVLSIYQAIRNIKYLTPLNFSEPPLSF